MPTVLLTQCLQVDFTAPLRPEDELPNQLHIGYDEARRLLGEDPAASPLAQLMAWARRTEGVHLVHIRDHHDPADPAQEEHLRVFGRHCVKGEPGARLLLGWDEGLGPREHLVDASGLNDFEGTTLAATLDAIAATAPGEPLRAGVVGVWTDAKVSFLLYDLKTRRRIDALATCSALTASRSRERHFQALDQLRAILDVAVLDSVAEFADWLQRGARLAGPARGGATLGLRLTGASLDAASEAVLAHLFRDAVEVDLFPLAGGFSGASVFRAASKDAQGHRHADTVMKLGPPKEIGRERAGTERMSEILGNAVPRVKGFVDVGDRAGLRFAWASMGVGGVRTLKSLFEKRTDDDEVVRVIDAVFDEVLAPLYGAAVYDRLPLLEAYGFAQFASGVRPRVEAILGAPASGDTIALPGGRTARNLCLFYERDVKELAGAKSESHYVSWQHGDLNWANILRDGRGNVWVIDFARAVRGHVLMDLAKLENDLLYILTPLDDDRALEEAVDMTFALRGIADLRRGLEGIEPPRHPALARTWRVLERLRARAGALCREDRHPIQLHTALLRYAVHTLGFDESSPRQRRWALASACVWAEEISATMRRDRALRVDWIDASALRAGGGRLGMTLCPGRVDKGRRLEEDLAALRAHGVTRLVCLLGEEELSKVGVGALPEAARAAGLAFDRRPIADQGVPTLEEARAWIGDIGKALGAGESVVVHCMGGLGRTGTIAACALAARGLAPAEAIAAVRRARGPRALETPGQERFVAAFAGA